MKTTNWVLDIDATKLLTGDVKDIAELIGVENLLLLIDRFNKTPIYFSDRVLLPMKREYILKYRGQVDARVLARKLDVSERFVYNVFEASQGAEDQMEMFEKKE